MNRKPNVTLEICASSIQSVVTANEAGAHRIELCANLEQGGITPSYGLIRHSLRISTIPVHVLIRPRAGDFIYDEDEIATMIEDIKLCKRLDCHGVVFGVLTSENTIDVPRLRELIRHADPLPVTFHRAFDDCMDRKKALEDVITSGCTRILTSGGHNTASEGLKELRELVELAADRIFIMPGAGVVPDNVVKIIRSTGVTEIHASAKTVVRAPSTQAASRFDMDLWTTSSEVVRSLVEELRTLDTD